VSVPQPDRTVHEVFGSGSDGYAAATGFLASLECELEALRNPPSVVGSFAGKKDGSLRNNGYEYVSSYAQSRENLVKSFEHLHKNLTFYDKHDPYSHRTSTHVHVNVCSLKVSHVKNMLLLYALFEEFFFAMVKPYRRDNIHCVLLTDTYLPKDYGKTLPWLVEKWHKYTALNLKPVANFGSVEFRHLHGTGDVVEVDTWLHVLENLWKLCQKVEVDSRAIADPAQRSEWFDLLFFPSASAMALKGVMPNIIKNSLIDVKFSTI
jgi:hypothetical protein